MKSPRIVFAILLISAACSVLAQEKEIIKVGAGEYFTTYLTSDKKLFATAFTGNRYAISKVPVNGIVDVDGAQYTNIALDTAGRVYITGIHKNGVLYAKQVKEDEGGNTFEGNEKVYGWYQGYLTIKSGELWMWGQDLLMMNKGVDIPAPRKLLNPKGKLIKKIVPMTSGEHSLLALATDGSVWIYKKGKPAPVKAPVAQAARDIAGVGAACYVVETANDLLAWGYLGSYLGAADLGITPVSIKKLWTQAGCKFPSKELVGNYNTLHIIDANDNLFGAGENVMGEIGNGKQYPNWAAYPGSPFAWNWQHRQMITKPVQIPGKFKNLCTGNTITFYLYVQDPGNNWYSWGRNKARCLGNGLTLSVKDESIYPNALNVPAPAKVSPLTTKWKTVRFHIDSIPDPIANAGINQFIKTPVTKLDGSLSSQDGGTIASFEWKQVSGEPVTIHQPQKSSTNVTGIKPGSYTFQLTVTNNRNVQATDTVSVAYKL